MFFALLGFPATVDKLIAEEVPAFTILDLDHPEIAVE